MAITTKTLMSIQKSRKFVVSEKTHQRVPRTVYVLYYLNHVPKRIPSEMQVESGNTFKFDEEIVLTPKEYRLFLRQGKRPMNYKPMTLLGRLLNGMESDRGSLVHAVALLPHKRPPCPFNDFGKKVIPDDDFKTMKSLCGKVPGKRSVGWESSSGEISCPKCLAKIKGVK